MNTQLSPQRGKREVVSVERAGDGGMGGEGWGGVWGGTQRNRTPTNQRVGFGFEGQTSSHTSTQTE